MITSHFALPLLIRKPGGLVVEMTDGTREYNAEQYRFIDLDGSQPDCWALSRRDPGSRPADPTGYR